MGLRLSLSALIKNNKIFLIYKEIRKGAVAKSVYEQGLPNIIGKAQIFNHI
jgi:hypothetical protein